MIGAIIARNWQAAAGMVAVAAILLLWQADRRAQFALGASETRAKYERLINKSKELTDDEKAAAIAAGTAAARSVCIEQKLPPADCEGL